jgi:hypothetical protein
MSVNHQPCTLCKAPLSEPITYIEKCKHPFHSQCWDAAVKTHAVGAKVFCPTCEQEISSKEEAQNHVKKTSLSLLGKIIKYIPYLNVTLAGGMLGALVEAAILGTTTLSLVGIGFFTGALAAIPIAYLASKKLEHWTLNNQMNGWEKKTAM